MVDAAEFILLYRYGAFIIIIHDQDEDVDDVELPVFEVVGDGVGVVTVDTAEEEEIVERRLRVEATRVDEVVDDGVGVFDDTAVGIMGNNTLRTLAWLWWFVLAAVEEFVPVVATPLGEAVMRGPWDLCIYLGQDVVGY